jgi:hypothetical protein
MSEMLTAAKMAEKLGISQGKIKKAITELNIQPDETKGRCAYFSEATAEKIKTHVESK